MQDHQDLADFLTSLKGMVVISGYDHDIYNRLGGEKVTKETRADKAGKRTECLWIKPKESDG
jgi:DNA adenine methylase